MSNPPLPPASTVGAANEPTHALHNQDESAQRRINEAPHESELNEVIFDPSDFVAKLNIDPADDQPPSLDRGESWVPSSVPAYNMSASTSKSSYLSPYCATMTEGMSRQSSVTSASDVEFVDMSRVGSFLSASSDVLPPLDEEYDMSDLPSTTQRHTSNQDTTLKPMDGENVDAQARLQGATFVPPDYATSGQSLIRTTAGYGRPSKMTTAGLDQQDPRQAQLPQSYLRSTTPQRTATPPLWLEPPDPTALSSNSELFDTSVFQPYSLSSNPESSEQGYESTSSISSAEIRARQRRQEQIERGKRPILAKSLLKHSSKIGHVGLEDPRTREALHKKNYVRPSHPKLLCNQCDDFPNGFRGEHELRRHREHAHTQRRKVWICEDPHTETPEGWRPQRPLEICKQCKGRKPYNVYYNAAAHLRRAHFFPRKRGRRAQGEERESRVGKLGANHPPIDWLKSNGFLKEIEIEGGAMIADGNVFDLWDEDDTALESHYDNLVANDLDFMPDYPAYTYATPEADYEMLWSNNYTTLGSLNEAWSTEQCSPLGPEPGRATSAILPHGKSPVDEGYTQGPEMGDHEADNVSVHSIDVDIARSDDGLDQNEDVGTVAPAFTDSGYRSMERKEQPDVGETDFDDNDSIRSDNRDSGLTFEVKRCLASEFARELADNVTTETTEAIFQIVSALPELLQQYSMIAHCEALPGIQQRAAVFVRHQRNVITQSLRSELLCRPDKSNDPNSTDRIELLWNQDRNVVHQEPMEYQEEHSTEFEDDGPIIPEFAEVRQYLVESPEYVWLTSRVMSLSRMMSTASGDTRIRRLAIDLLYSAKELRLELLWSPAEFFREQYGGSIDLGQVLCYSGLAHQAYITTCGDYVKRMWPSFGNEIVDIVTRAASSASNRFAAVLSDNTSLIIELKDHATEIVAKGPTTTLIELVEVFVWLGATCRASKNELTAYCIPYLRGDHNPTDPVKTCQVSYNLKSIGRGAADDTSDSGGCWQALSRNPTIAKGYPIPTRTNNEIGAEMSIGAMARLGCTPLATRFTDMIFLKGFCTMFVPVLTVGQSIVWHFLIDNNQKRISYNDGLSIPSTVGFIDYSKIETSRHFVGWAPSAKILAGTKGACYNISRSTGELATAGTGALSEVSLGFSKLLSLDATFVRGKKDTPLALLDHRPYEWQIIAASEINVVFYDTDRQTSWLLDGATGLLHLCRAWLSSKFAMTLPKGAIESFQHASNHDGRESAIRALLCQENRELPLYKSSERTSEITIDPATRIPVKVDKIKESWFCWENLVQSKWNIIEQIHDHVVRLRTSGPSDLPRLKPSLEGFEFVDMLTEPTQIRPRTVDVRSTAGNWVEFMEQNESVNIFGSGFGNLILPDASEGQLYASCSQHGSVPTGMNYLAAPMYVLNDITRKHRKAGALWLGRSIYWTNPERCFNKCTCASQIPRSECRPTLARLRCSKVFWRKSQAPHPAFFDRYLGGAVLFGEDPNVLWKCLSKRPLESSGVPTGQTRPHASDSGVDFLSSHSSHSSGSTQESSGAQDSAFGSEST